MKKILAIFALFIFLFSANAQDTSTKKLSRKELRKALAEFSLDKKKFVELLDNPTDGSKQKNTFEFSGNLVTLTETTEKDLQKKVKVFTGDVVKNETKVSIRLTKLNDKPIQIPIVFNMILENFRDYWVLLDSESRNVWVDASQYIEK